MMNGQKATETEMTSHRISTTETETERKATETETERTPRKRRGVQKETETIITDAKIYSMFKCTKLGPGTRWKCYGRNPKKREGIKVQQRAYLFL